MSPPPLDTGSDYNTGYQTPSNHKGLSLTLLPFLPSPFKLEREQGTVEMTSTKENNVAHTGYCGEI